MDAYEHSRLAFIRKLGLTLGATVLPSTFKIAYSIADKREEIELSEPQVKFMQHYEKWMDDFIPVIRRQKENPEDYENNKKIVELSEIAKSWQNELVGYMKDENFARYYLIASERMTHEI
jgi:hypothetical protein